MTAKETAIQDIKDELEKENKCFIAYYEELNPIMDSLVENQLQEQLAITDGFCLSGYSY